MEISDQIQEIQAELDATKVMIETRRVDYLKRGHELVAELRGGLAHPQEEIRELERMFAETSSIAPEDLGLSQGEWRSMCYMFESQLIWGKAVFPLVEAGHVKLSQVLACVYSWESVFATRVGISVTQLRTRQHDERVADMRIALAIVERIIANPETMDISDEEIESVVMAPWRVSSVTAGLEPQRLERVLQYLPLFQMASLFCEVLEYVDAGEVRTCSAHCATLAKDMASWIQVHGPVVPLLFPMLLSQENLDAQCVTARINRLRHSCEKIAGVGVLYPEEAESWIQALDEDRTALARENIGESFGSEEDYRALRQEVLLSAATALSKRARVAYDCGSVTQAQRLLAMVNL